MKTALHHCRLWGIVTGDEPKPAGVKAGELSEWEKKDAVALVLIFKCCKTDVVRAQPCEVVEVSTEPSKTCEVFEVLFEMLQDS